MEQTSTDILKIIDSVLENLRTEAGGDSIAQFRQVLETNFARGRIEKFTGGDPQKIEAYVRETFGAYQQRAGYVRLIQVQCNEEAWTELYQKMCKWAYATLLRYNFVPGPQSFETAKSCASDAAIRVLNAHYPYDTEFDSWARVTTHYACLNFFRSGSKPSNPANAASLDDQGVQGVDPDQPNPEVRASIRLDLLDAIEKLSPARKQVIFLSYFKGLSAAKIAAHLGRTVGAVYNLRHHALNDLRKILGESWDSYE